MLFEDYELSLEEKVGVYESLEYWQYVKDHFPYDHVAPAAIARRVKMLDTGMGRRAVMVASKAPQRVDYNEYIASAAWSAKSLEAKRRAGFQCAVCTATKTLDTHHRTYDRLGHEDWGDLIVLCHDCHDLYHKAGRLPQYEAVE